MENNTPQPKFPWTKHFWLNVLSSTVGFIIGGIICTLLLFILIIAMIGSSSTDTAVVKSNSLLHINLEGAITEQQQDNTLQSLFGDGEESIGLDKILKAIKIAKDNDDIKGIWLESGALSSYPATLQELRQALQDFKKSGKPIYAYGNDVYGQGAYYLCSVADTVALNPIGSVDWHGMSSQIMFYKDLMAKLGVKMQVYKVGTYKSAVEPYTETQMSPANREQITAYLTEIWQTWVNDICKARKMQPDKANELADKCMVFAGSKETKASGLVDLMMYKDEFTNLLKKKLGVEEDDDLNLVSPSTLCDAADKQGDMANQVAVYYAEGEIVEEASPNPMSEGSVVGEKVCKDLQKLAKDDNVKAVVLRINSPGGSAFASEQMWHNIKVLAKKKPVVVSMGGVAASGGYYIAAGADYIFAEPSTITGSIGIFGMIPDASELLTNKLGLKFDVVNTNKMSDFGNIGRPFNAEEGQRLQAHIEEGYTLFMTRVADARKKTLAQVDSIGQGRVWTGSQALKLGLVDKLGSLQDAINYAASKAKLKEGYAVVGYPEVLPWYAMLGIDDAEEQAFAGRLRSMLGDFYEPLQAINAIKNGCTVYARLPYIIKIK